MTAATSTPIARNPWRIAAVALLPILVLGLLLAALWNPQDRLDQVPAAIVNLDEPVEQDGQPVPLGRQLASGLVGGGETAEGSKAVVPDDDQVNFDWTITDADGAEAGLADGTYSAVVTIPEDFSAAATSFGGDDASQARQATIDVATPPGGRVADDALARVVAGTATDVMSSTLTETYVDNVLVGFSDLADGIGEAQDGATQLADGAGDAAGGADQLADGAGEVADGAGQLASGVGELGTGADQLASGAGDLAGGADELAGGVAQSASGADGVAGGVEELAAGTHGLAGGARDLADGLGRLDDQTSALPGQAQQLATGSAGVAAGVDGIVDQLGPVLSGAGDGLAGLESALGCGGGQGAAPDLFGDLPADVRSQIPAAVREQAEQQAAAQLAAQTQAICDELATQQTDLGEQSANLEKLQGAAHQVADGNQQLADGLGELSGGVGELSTGADGLASGVEETASGADDLATGARGLADGLGQLSGGANSLASGAGDLATGSQGLASGVDELGTGATQLATGTEGLATGTGDLSNGVGRLAGGAGDLADGLGEAKDGIPTYSDDERQTLSSVVAQPVAGPSTGGLSTGASGPLFAVVALWLGALALLTVFPPVAARALGSTRSSVRLTLTAFGLPALVAAGTGAVVGGILAGVEGLDAGGWAGAIGLGVLASVSFVAVHQGLVGLLGNLGRGISLLVAVLIIATGVVSTVPAVLENLVALLPVGAARDALTAVVVPAAGGLGVALTALVVWALAGLALAVLVTARSRRVPVRRLVAA